MSSSQREEEEDLVATEEEERIDFSDEELPIGTEEEEEIEEEEVGPSRKRPRRVIFSQVSFVLEVQSIPFLGRGGGRG